MKAKFVFFQLALFSLMITSCMTNNDVKKMCSARAEMDFSKAKVDSRRRVQYPDALRRMKGIGPGVQFPFRTTIPRTLCVEVRHLYKDIRSSPLLGDGDEWIVLDFGESGAENIEEEIKQSPNWKYFNQNEELKEYCYSRNYFDVPEEGYFCIIDWQQPEEKKFDYSLIKSRERYSYNYTIMIYDPYAKKLYSYSLDT